MAVKRIVTLCIWMGLLCAGIGRAEADLSGQPIGSVETVGNITISRSDVLAQIRTRVGQPFDPPQVEEDIRRIAQLEGVDTAYYNAEPLDGRVKLTYVVVEQNLVREIILEGNDKFSDTRLLKETGLRQGDYLDVFAARSGVEKLMEFYQDKGYPFVSVTLDEGRLMMGTLKYTIVEGPRTKITDIRFEGNEVFSDKELLKAIDAREKKFFFWSTYYNPQMIEDDVETLLEVYRDHAYLDARAEKEVVFGEDQETAEIIFRIEEGPVYLVEDIAIQGNEFFETAALREGMRLREDFYYSADRLEFDVNRVRNMYREQGFLNVAVEAQRTFLPDARVDVTLDIEEGDRFRIGEVTISGNVVTEDRVFRRILDEEGFTPGEWYNAAGAAGTGEGELERTVKSVAVAESVSITPTGREEGTRDAVVQVTEGQTGMVMLGAGVASDSGVIGQISLDQRNFDITDLPESWNELITGKAFRGAGQRFRVLLSPGTRWSTYSVSFTEPYLFDRPVSLDTAFSSYTRLRESYDEERLGVNFGFTKRYADEWRRGIAFRTESVDVADVEDDAPPEVMDEEGSHFLFGSRLWFGRDTTDSRFRPSRGANFDVGYEQVVGDSNFGVLSGTYRWYNTLYEDLAELKTVLETKVHAGTIIGDAPIFEKFYAGGINSIRGFEYRGVSPRGTDSDDPIGSDWIVVTNAQVAVPLGSETFALLFFGDAAMVETGGPRLSVGSGLQIMIPQVFGPVPMRFEFGVPVMKDEEDDTQLFNFSVGALF